MNKDIIVEPVEVVKSLYPIRLLRKIYLSIMLFAKKDLIDRAASGAFYFLLSIIPLALLFVYFFDMSLAGYGNVSDYFFQLLSRINPEINKAFFNSIGLLNDDKRGLFGVFGILGLVWSSRSVFSGITKTFDSIFEGKNRSFIADSLISLVFIPLIFAISMLLFFATVLTNYAIKIFNHFDIPMLKSLITYDHFSSVLNILMVFIFTFLLYRFLPAKRPKSRDAITGAILFTLAFLTLNKGLYGVLSIAKYYLVYGIISTLIVGLFWIYINFSMFYLFAQFVYVQSEFEYLEFDIYYQHVALGQANFIERFIFRGADEVLSKYKINFSKGDYIYKHGDIANSLYILYSGEVETYFEGSVTKIIKKDEMFGINGVLAVATYDKDAVAKSDCIVIKLNKEFYEHAASLNPKLAQNVMGEYLQRLFK